jgi:hypothetical protein
MSQPSPGNCPVQIQVYVDTNAAKQNSTDGVYMVDNRVNSGSTGEGRSVSTPTYPKPRTSAFRSSTSMRHPM